MENGTKLNNNLRRSILFDFLAYKCYYIRLWV